MQKGDVIKTHASINMIKKITGFKPVYNLNTGIKKFILWYKEYYISKK